MWENFKSPPPPLPKDRRQGLKILLKTSVRVYVGAKSLLYLLKYTYIIHFCFVCFDQYYKPLLDKVSPQYATKCGREAIKKPLLSIPPWKKVNFFREQWGNYLSNHAK